MTDAAAAQKTALRAKSPYYDLAKLIAPFDLATFKSDYYEKQPLLIQRDDPEYYSDLLTLGDLDHILSVANFRADNTRVHVDGQEIPINELSQASGKTGNELELIYARYRSGSTIVVNALNERWEPIQRLCRSLDIDADLAPQVNVYLTPPRARGFNAHYDTHDVFMMQVYGSKHWRLYGAAAELPLRTQPYRRSEEGPGKATQEFDLSAGDVVYLPRGTVHEGVSNETASMHITIGLHPMLWATVVKNAVQSVIDSNVAFRRALPMGFSTDESLRMRLVDTAESLFGLLRTHVSVPEAVDQEVRRVSVEKPRPELRHHLTDLAAVDRLDLETRVRRRPEVTGMLAVDRDTISVEFHGKTVNFPAHVANEVRYIAESNGDGFTPAEIVGELDDAGRVLLVQTLLREGLLTTS